MAREIILSVGGKDSHFTFSKLTRQKLYGRKKRITVDVNGEPCSRSSLALDGSVVIKSGMLAQGYFDENHTQLSRKDLVGMDSDGKELPLIPRTLNVSQIATEVTPTELLNLRVVSIYILTSDNLDEDLKDSLNKGSIFSFPFNYNADFHAEVGFVVSNKDGYFAIIGVPTEPDWIGHEIVQAQADELEHEWDDDDLDFEMF